MKGLKGRQLERGMFSSIIAGFGLFLVLYALAVAGFAVGQLLLPGRPLVAGRDRPVEPNHVSGGAIPSGQPSAVGAAGAVSEDTVGERSHEPSAVAAPQGRVQAETISEEWRARVARLVRILQIAWVVLLAGTFIYLIAQEHAKRSAIVAPPSPPGATDETAPVVVTADGPLPWMVLTTGILMAAGVVLLCTRGSATKAAGALTLLTGLAGSGFSFVKELKVDKFSVDLNPKIDAIVKTQLGAVGPQHLATFEGFKIGKAKVDLEEPRGETDKKLARACATWNEARKNGREGVLLAIGSADRLPLRGKASQRYEANVGLARARAEAVVVELFRCADLSPRNVLVLVSGPRHTPEESAPPTGFSEDRSVDLWALWGTRAEAGRANGADSATNRDDSATSR